MLGIMTDFTSALGGAFIDPFRAYKLKKESAGAGAASLAVMKSTACGLGSMAGVVTKGAFVDTPLAFAEGFRNIPHLYGEEPKHYGKVTGWQSGGVVAAKVNRPLPPSLKGLLYADLPHTDVRLWLLSWPDGHCDPAIQRGEGRGGDRVSEGRWQGHGWAHCEAWSR